MDSYLNNTKLHNHIEVGMDLTLARCTCVHDKKLHLIIGFQPWLDAIKELDIDLQAECMEGRAELEIMMESLHLKSCDDHTLSKPSRKYNSINSSSTKSAAPLNAPSCQNSKDYPPKLTPNEGSLLINNHGCTKCQKAYIFPMKFDCPNDFSKGSGYKVVTQATIDAARHVHESRSKKPVGTIATTSTNTTMGPSAHPVAAIMGYSSNPTGYMVNYSSAVLTNDEEVDELASSEGHKFTHAAAVVENVDVAAPNNACLLTANTNPVAPITVPHMFWHASVSPPDSLPLQFDCLLDIGLHLVIIQDQLINDLKLHHQKLQNPIISELVIQPDGPKVLEFNEYVKLKLYDSSGTYTAKTVHAVICWTLCTPVLLGLPFLQHNNIVIDVNSHTAIDKKNQFNLLHPNVPTKKPVQTKLWFNYEKHKTILNLHTALLNEMKSSFSTKQKLNAYHKQRIKKVDIVGAVRERLKDLAAQQQLKRMGLEVFDKYKCVFEPIPHVDELPTNVYCQIQLKDATKYITMRTYSSPQKYQEAWRILLKHHKDARWIWPSNLLLASPSFLVPKTDSTVLPCWVNDYQVLYSNTVLNSYSLPCVDDILADCAEGHIWSHLDMTNSFFHMRVHPDDIHLTAVTTPFGLYEWTAMPQGLKNAPPIHQCWMNAALHPLIGKFVTPILTI